MVRTAVEVINLSEAKRREHADQATMAAAELDRIAVELKPLERRLREEALRKRGEEFIN